MKLFEYEAKETFRGEGIPVPKSVLIESVDKIEEAAHSTGLPCMIKAQVLQGGRGKAGLIKKADTQEEAAETADYLLENGPRVKKILVEEALDIKQEVYLSVTVDPVKAKAVIIACADGGVDIETMAREYPEKIVKEEVDVTAGLQSYQIKNIAFALGFSGDVFKQFNKICNDLFKVFVKYDAELAEINPLIITKEDKVIAGDAKLNIDDGALHRQPRFQRRRDHYESHAEYTAAQEGIPYLQFDGDISLMCAGAGLTTTVYDLIIDHGGSISNYLEFGGPNYRKGVRAMELCLKNRNAKAILIVTFGTIARADVMASSIVEALEKHKPEIPIVTCIRGTNEEEAVKILESAGLIPLFDTEEAVIKAVELSKGVN